MSSSPPALRLAFALPDLLRAPDAQASGPAPALARLLAAAGAPALEPEGLGAALAALFGVARQSDWPLAAIRAAALGLEPRDAYWIAADPVTLVAGRDDVRLTGVVDDLSAAQSAALLATLNAHFAADGIAFVAPRPDIWLVRAAAAPDLKTTALEAALGRTLRTLLPTGADAGTWRRWHNEIQMLLHEHPVNAEREASGLPPANSVWFSGGGTPPLHGSTRSAPGATSRQGGAAAARVFADGGIATALAAFAGAPAQPLPAGLDPALAAANDAPLLVVAFAAPPDLASIEPAWIAPAWRALAAGRVETVTIIGSGDGGAAIWTARRAGAWARFTARFTAIELAPLLAAARAQLADET